MSEAQIKLVKGQYHIIVSPILPGMDSSRLYHWLLERSSKLNKSGFVTSVAQLPLDVGMYLFFETEPDRKSSLRIKKFLEELRSEFPLFNSRIVP